MLRNAVLLSVLVGITACGGQSISDAGSDAGAPNVPPLPGNDERPPRGAGNADDGGAAEGPRDADGAIGSPRPAPDATPDGDSSSFGGAPGNGSTGSSLGGAPWSGAGSAGTSGVAGGAGFSGSVPDECIAPVANPDELREWEEPSASTLDEELVRIRAGMVGSFWGVVSTPWTAPYPVTVSFAADGHYSARCGDDDDHCCLAFYYGTDKDTELKTYELTHIGDSGAAGSIVIAFDYGAEGFGAPGWKGELVNVQLDASGDRLRFDFKRSDGYGPVEFDLERASP